MSRGLLYSKAKAKHKQQEKKRREWEPFCFALKLPLQNIKMSIKPHRTYTKPLHITSKYFNGLKKKKKSSLQL